MFSDEVAGRARGVVADHKVDVVLSVSLWMRAVGNATTYLSGVCIDNLGREGAMERVSECKMEGVRERAKEKERGGERERERGRERERLGHTMREISTYLQISITSA